MIGDVTGHGFYSGLFVAMAKSCLHTQAQIDYSAEKIMEAMNRTVPISMDSGQLMLMSCCYILIDLQNLILTYSNAGHPYPYHYRKNTNTIERLYSTDMLLGIPGFEESKFTKKQKKWEKGDLLVLYSDGITEAENADKEQFGDERLREIILENRDKSTNYVKNCILKAFSAHCDCVVQNDDVTLVVVRSV
jgi:sigma-B regulation protein RsbU (phosphoserine phosphatase)